MKKIYLFITLFAFANTVKSQTLNTGHFPSPGDVHQYFNTDTLGIVAGPAGTAQVWNFEDLNVDTVLQIDSYLAPIVTTPPITGTTTVIGTDTTGYSFFKNTSTEYTMLGFSDSANINITNYSNAMTMITFPFAFGNTATDNFAFTTTFQGNNVDATGTVTTTADGIGNLLLPQGAFNNVIRVKYNVVTNFTVSFLSLTQTQTIYEWYDGIYKFPLLHVESSSITDPFGGAPILDKIVWVKATGPAGIESKSNKIDFSLAPNPAQDQVNVKLNQLNAATTKIIITNAVGQLVYEHNNVNSNLSNLNISTSDLEKGIYFVSVIQNDQTFTKKLVVQ
jgi:hypothetical protein